MNTGAQLYSEAAARVSEMLARPMPSHADDLGIEGDFNPWDIFPCLYGSYDCEFDRLAIEVLCDLRDGTHNRGDLPANMLREMLCNANLCDYGTSPRTCFPSTEFKALLPDLIQRWRAYAEMKWGEPVTESR